MDALTRRRFIQKSLAALTIMGLSERVVVGSALNPSTSALMNHVGFLPGGAKYALFSSAQPVDYSIVDTATGNAVRTGRATPSHSGLGDYALVDFSDLSKAGLYEIRSERFSAGRFVVQDDVYLPIVSSCVGYFARQRCGDSHSGYNAPCHLDDGRRASDGARVNATGGWHDACDVRKWVDATIYGMIGLSRALDVLGLRKLDARRTLDELRWGNSYFLRMQHDDGFVMNTCGGDSGNEFTDNRAGTADDRTIDDEPCELPAQFQFVGAQATMARLFGESDPSYAKQCQAAGERALEWCVTKRNAGAVTSLSAGIIAALQLQRARPSSRWATLVAGLARQLLELQGKAPAHAKELDDRRIAGFFFAARDRLEPSREIQHGNLPLLALCELLEVLPNHSDQAAWRSALEMHVGYVRLMCGQSPFGIAPFGLYSKGDPGGGRRIGNYWYRWFMPPRGENAHAPDWWVGINSHLASNGIGLVKASRLLKDPALRNLGQQHLDWILGVNPFNASTVTGYGRNQPPLYRTGAFRPTTPEITGGVMNGIGGNENDEPVLAPGSYNTCEYWTPMVAHTMWLCAELSA